MNYAILFDSPLPADPNFYLLVVGMLVIIVALLKPNPSIVTLTWTRNVQRAIVVIGFVASAVGAVGVVSEGGLLGPKKDDVNKTVSSSNASKTESSACTVEGLNGQAYFNVGHVWNDLHQYDEAMKYFNCSELAINKDIKKDPANLERWWPTRGYLYREWGHAFQGIQQCEAALDKFQKAKSLFESHHENDGGDTQKGISDVNEMRHRHQCALETPRAPSASNY